MHGLQHYIRKPTGRTFRFISSLEQLQLVLLNAAVGEPSLLPQNVNFSSDYLGYKQNWNSELFVNGLRDRYSEEFIRNNTLVDFADLRLFWIPTITELAAYTDLRLYNVMSSNDMADRYLYRIGSIGERGGPLCAIGACKLRQWQHSVEVSNSGALSEIPNLKKSNVWNVDASEVVYSHSDIYKGRVANLIWELLSLELPPIEENDVVTDSPDYKEKEVSSFTSLASQYEYFRRINVQAMVGVNASRLLGERRKLELQRVVSLLFDLDDHFKKHEWALAETTLKSLIDANECIAGWWWQESLGVICES